MASKGNEELELQKAITSLGADRSRWFEIWRRPEPQLLPIPATVRGFRLRIDLRRTKPPVWRRIDVPGDILLPRLHDVIQAAMGWDGGHLHRFATSNDRNRPEFLTQFDLDEGDEGMLENDVRLNQVLADAGDRLWYDYDFGDGWEHVLRVEQVLESAPLATACIGGRLACPPEDCGGPLGYSRLAAWVRSDYDDALRPEVFESTEDGLDWLPEGWHPDEFDVDEANEFVAAAAGEPIPVIEELQSLLDRSRPRGTFGLRDALADPSASGATSVEADEAVELIEPFQVLLDVISDGEKLTGAGYLQPATVEQIARRTGITEWWIGKANREDLTPPIAELRASAQALGLVSVRQGCIAPTRAVTALRGDPQGILRLIADRLPLSTRPAERRAGWMALVVVANETPAEFWRLSISSLLLEQNGHDREGPSRAPSPESPTLSALRLLAGELRSGWRIEDVKPAVSALARAVIQA